MPRQPLSPEAEAAIARLNDVMRKLCDDVERRKAERHADRRSEEEGRIANELGYNL
jgi:hypothetical protein